VTNENLATIRAGKFSEMKANAHDLKATLRFGHHYVRNKLIRPFPPCNGNDAPKETRARVEIHMLTSQRDYAMACWTLVSYQAASRRSDRLILHDDGSLKHEDVERIHRIFPAARVISREEADAKVHGKFKNCPLLLNLRKRLPHIMKILDFCTFCESSRFIMVDSDVLFLLDPCELFETGELHLFSRDIESTYVVAPGELEKKSGVNRPPRINCGIANVWKEGVDTELMEWVLGNADIDLEGCPPTIEQTLWAIECGRRGFKYLPDSYRICSGPGLEGIVAKHYVGMVLNRFSSARDYFFVEGIPAIRRLLRCARTNRNLEGRLRGSFRTRGAKEPEVLQ
jgi:hypothetical protein